ncbi:MAG: ATP-dependent DNA ligase [Candidatus Bathyarchaeota archaeon]|nr:ATP-dependent DNA ligase [Candidatus Bathyarchaeota archaeon]
MPTLFKDLADLLEKIAATRKRLEIVSLTADFLKSLDAEETEPAVSMILGNAFPKYNQKTLDISWTTLSKILQRVTNADWKIFLDAFSSTGDIGSATKALFEKTTLKKQTILFTKPLTITEVRRNLEAIAETSGSGAREKKERLLTALLSQASPTEAKYLVKILTHEMRTGLHEGLMEQATAKAFDLPLTTVQKANMTLGDIGEVAATAKTKGKNHLFTLNFKIFRPVKPMLAQTASDINEALVQHNGETSFEYKYDGARIQIHKQNGKVQVFSRRLTDATSSLPDIVESIKNNIVAHEAILEGEVIATDNSGNPIPFQHLMRRFKRVHDIADAAEKIPLKLYLFDALYINGKNLISLPYTQRRQTLSENAGEIPLTTQIITNKQETAEKFLQEAIAAGHEGVMAKNPNSPYTPGTRGKHWLKIKQTLDPLDLVITAAEYGYGRRHEWLSDYYLAARDPETGNFLTIGKTFKGLTDTEIINLTRQLKETAITEEHRHVTVIPKIVVEVTYNEIQHSPKYNSHMALRFARINRLRPDKQPEDADTITKVKNIYEKQFAKKGRYKTEP